MKITNLLVDGVEILDPIDGVNKHLDSRGCFIELYGQDNEPFVKIEQISQSISKAHVIRGLHFQYEPAMEKLVRCVAGSAVFHFVDIRPGHPPTKDSITLFGSNSERLVYVPGYCALGFEALVDNTVIEYWHNSKHNPKTIATIAHDDPDVGIIWPSSFSEDKILSERDSNGMSYKEWIEFAKKNNTYPSRAS